MSEWDDDFEEMCNGSGLADSGDGCYIATAVYGSYDCPEVWTLRRYRDQRLRQSAAGRGFIKAYYAISPVLVARFGHLHWLRAATRRMLDRFVVRLHCSGYADSPYHDAE